MFEDSATLRGDYSRLPRYLVSVQEYLYLYLFDMHDGVSLR